MIGRRLPWTGDNFGVLRAACWQIHGYGEVTASGAPDLGVPATEALSSTVAMYDLQPGAPLVDGMFDAPTGG